MFGRFVVNSALRAARRQPRPQCAERAFTTARQGFRPSIRSQIGQAQQRRQLSTREAFREQVQKSPILFPLALLTCVIGGVSLFIYAPYVYVTYILGEFHKFPEPVAKKLRRALYYSNHQVDPAEAIKYYKQALQVADELGLDPFSDEMLGVKIQVAAFYEKIENYEAAIKVLEVVRRDCLLWVEKLGDKHWNDGKRTRVLAKAVAISIKLGDLYASQYVQDREAAEEQLVWAVETVLREKQRRATEGVKEGEGDWVSDEEFGNGLVSLAHNYEAKNLHYLATPLFLHALSLLPKNTCESVVLMNNIASSLAQQTPPPANLPSQPSPNAPVRKSPPSKLPPKPSPNPSQATSPDALFPTDPAPNRNVFLAQSRKWAEKAIALSQSIPASSRTEDCDIGCAVAAHNLGEIAEMLGQKSEARQRYEQARDMARKLGFGEGVSNAQSALERLAAAA